MCRCLPAWKVITMSPSEDLRGTASFCCSLSSCDCIQQARVSSGIWQEGQALHLNCSFASGMLCSCCSLCRLRCTCTCELSIPAARSNLQIALHCKPDASG